MLVLQKGETGPPQEGVSPDPGSTRGSERTTRTPAPEHTAPFKGVRVMSLRDRLGLKRYGEGPSHMAWETVLLIKDMSERTAVKPQSDPQTRRQPLQTVPVRIHTRGQGRARRQGGAVRGAHTRGTQGSFGLFL